MMRSIYITWHWKLHPTHEDKKQLALTMRHSSDTAGKNYNKNIPDISPAEKAVAIDQKLAENVELKEEQVKIKQQLDDVKSHCKNAYEPDDKLYVKRRKDILYRYNRRNVQPKDSTMNKYNIKYDGNTKLYA